MFKPPVVVAAVGTLALAVLLLYVEYREWKQRR